MKTFVLVLTLVCLSASIHAQNAIDMVKDVNFYGIDFTKVKTFGVTEDPYDVKHELNQINFLFIDEMKKYDIEKYLNKKVLYYQTEPTVKINAEMDEKEMASGTNRNEVSEKDVQQIIDRLSCKNNDKTGLILIAENIDKANKKGTFQVVFFDEATKKIIYTQRASGKAMGFGVRNYWAKSVLEILKDWKY